MIPERALPWLKAACNVHARPWWGIDDIEDELAAGYARLWLGERSCVVTRVRDAGAERLLEIWVAGGELGELKDALPNIEAWGLAAECTQVVIDGRPGWVRELAALGYEQYSVSIRKLLT